MNFDFLFWLFFIGIIIAVFQDLKRREVDDWLNLFLIFASFSFIFFRAIFENNVSIIFQAGFALVVLFIFMNLFYYGRVFAGGDAKLLFAMTVFFMGINFIETLVNIGIFVLFLMISGSVYGLIYSFVLYSQNSKKVNKRIKEGFWVFENKLALIAGIILILIGLFHWIFLFLGFLLLIFPMIYVFAKELEDVSMVKEIPGKNLREGDWLVNDVMVGRKVIKADWGGLSLEDIKLMKKMKKIKIKEGLPFVPAFLIAFLLYVFFKDVFLRIVFGFA